MSEEQTESELANSNKDVSLCLQVSCGGHHMLVLATPRPAESQEVVPEKDVLITDDFLESSFTKIIFKNKFINPTPPSPLSALSARARHRDRVRPFKLLLSF